MLSLRLTELGIQVEKGHELLHYTLDRVILVASVRILLAISLAI